MTGESVEITRSYSTLTHKIQPHISESKIPHAQLTFNGSQQQVMSPQCNSLVTSCKKTCVIATVFRVRNPLVSSDSPSCLLPWYRETSKIQREKTISGPRSRVTSSRFDALVSELPSPHGPRREFYSARAKNLARTNYHLSPHLDTIIFILEP